METDSTENNDQVESTIKPEAEHEPEPEPDVSVEHPEPVELPKPKRRGRPIGTRDAYKMSRKSNASKPNASLPVPPSNTPLEERYTYLEPPPPLGVDMNTLADLMLERMTLRASDARAQKAKHWAKFMPNR